MGEPRLLKWLKGLIDHGREDDRPKEGQERTRKPDVREYYLIRPAHEAGHIVAHWYSPFTIQVGAVTTDDSGTRVWSEAYRGLPQSEWDVLVTYLAGMAGVTHAFGRTSTVGAQDDLLNARAIAEKLCEHDDPFQLRLWTCDEKAYAPDFTRAFRQPLPPQVQAVMASAFRRARELIRLHEKEFLILAEAVKHNAVLRIYDIEAIMGKRDWIDKKTLDAILRLSKR